MEKNVWPMPTTLLACPSYRPLKVFKLASDTLSQASLIPGESQTAAAQGMTRERKEKRYYNFQKQWEMP